MNGIAGVVYPDVYQLANAIVPMLETAQSGQGGTKDTHTWRNFQVGSNCSKILTNDRQTIVAAFCGNITNLQELSEELKNLGFKKTPSSPEDVIVHAYEHWGPYFIERVNGEFCIAILDHQKEKLLLYRDRIGRIPLYWYHGQNHFMFASQLKALLVTGIVPQSFAMDSLAAYLYFGYIPQDMTPVKDVNKLLPGHYLLLDKTRSIKILPYWSYGLCFEHQVEVNDEAVVKKIETQLESNIIQSLPQEGPLGCILMGGLGSASIAYFLQKIGGKERLKAFTSGFQGENEEDIIAASTAAATLGIQQVSDLVTPGNFLDDLIPICWHLDEPIADINVLATWRVCRAASQGVRVVYSGMGSDEQLAGHNRYTLQERKIDWMEHLKYMPINLLRIVLTPLLKMLYKPGAYTLLKESRGTPWQVDYLHQNALFSERMIRRAAPNLSRMFDPDVFLQKFHNLPNIKSRVGTFLYFDVKTRLADCFILQYERLTAAFGLDWRTPYLDRNLVEFLASVPEPETLMETETARTLKKLLGNIYPQEFIHRPKKTRRDMLKPWVEISELKKILPLLAKGSLVESGVISEKWIRKAILTTESRIDHFRYLWAILMLEIWFQLYVNRPIHTKAPKSTLLELLSER